MTASAGPAGLAGAGCVFPALEVSNPPVGFDKTPPGPVGPGSFDDLGQE